jgi:hypothetical protein
MRIGLATFAAVASSGAVALIVACSSSSSPAPAQNPMPDSGHPPPLTDAATMTTVAPDGAFISGQGDSRTITILNNCNQTVWLTGTPLNTLPGNGIVQMDPLNVVKVGVNDGWTGAFWTMTYCGTDGGVFACETDPTVQSRAELALAADPSTGTDTYDISFVNGFNVPIGVIPIGHPPYPANPQTDCGQSVCKVDLNQGCPAELAARVEGIVLGCANNLCQTLGHGNTTDPNCMYPNSDTEWFKNGCPTGYSYATDDATSKYTCVGKNDYEVVFCPQ